MYKNYGGIEFFYDKDWEFFVECLEYAVNKESEIPKLISMIFDNIMQNKTINPINKKMRQAEEIMKDYDLKWEV